MSFLWRGRSPGTSLSVTAFTTPYDADAKIFHVGTLGKNGLHNCAYKCKNIVLENCTFEKGTIDVEDGNELIIR